MPHPPNPNPNPNPSPNPNPNPHQVLAADRRPRSRRELAPDDPFLQLMSPKRCAQEVYIDSGNPAVPPLRRCKLAVMCAVLHLEDEPYARCIGSAEEEGRNVESG